jgi:hypothetical protein
MDFGTHAHLEVIICCIRRTGSGFTSVVDCRRCRSAYGFNVEWCILKVRKDLMSNGVY